MKSRMLSKGLAVAFILLFLGFAIQPSLAMVKSINIDVEYSSDSEEDCNCKPVSKQHIVRIKSLIDGIDTNKNKLSLLSKGNIDIEEKYKEKSIRFLALKKISKDYIFYWQFPVVCSSLFILQLSLILFEFLFLFNYNFPIVDYIIEIIDTLGFKLNCPWYIHPPPFKLDL